MFHPAVVLEKGDVVAGGLHPQDQEPRARASSTSPCSRESPCRWRSSPGPRWAPRAPSTGRDRSSSRATRAWGSETALSLRSSACRARRRPRSPRCRPRRPHRRRLRPCRVDRRGDHLRPLDDPRPGPGVEPRLRGGRLGAGRRLPLRHGPGHAHRDHGGHGQGRRARHPLPQGHRAGGPGRAPRPCSRQDGHAHQGRPKVTDGRRASCGPGRTSPLRLAAAAESRSEHPSAAPSCAPQRRAAWRSRLRGPLPRRGGARHRRHGGGAPGAGGLRGASSRGSAWTWTNPRRRSSRAWKGEGKTTGPRCGGRRARSWSSGWRPRSSRAAGSRRRAPDARALGR